ncbi:phage tail protein [Thermopolyspora sp. NPDC052614]|uniref:phage tail protein n=1 Tax=Thermopolyspora sp. NPDC052614 TaxID=3155682 RepID=UPI00343F28CB
MDVNGTRSHLLLGEDDWGRCDGSLAPPEEPAAAPPADVLVPLAEAWADGRDVEVVYDRRGAELTLRPRPFIFPSPPGTPPLDPAVRRGAARDRYGNWYWVDTVPTRLLVHSSGSRVTTQFWPPAGPPPRTRSAAGGFVPRDRPGVAPTRIFAGAAVTEDHYLVIGVTGVAGVAGAAGAGKPAETGLLIFDLQAGGPPDPLMWPDGVGFTPFDLAARPGGGVYALDRDRRRYWELDRHFLVVTAAPPSGQRAFFRSAGGAAPQAEPCPPPRRIREDDAVSVGEGDPIAIEAAPDGTVLVLLRDPGGGASSLRTYRNGAALGPAVPVADPRARLAVAGHDLALIPADPERTDSTGRLLVAGHQGDQVFEFGLSWSGGNLTLVAAERYLPLRLFGGKAIVAAAGRAWYDFGDRWLPVAEQSRRRYATTGTVVTAVLDGGEPGCVWHRLLLDARMPSETGVRVRSAAADDPQALAVPRWQDEPVPYARGDGPESPYLATGGYRTFELAFQRARGRYLRVKLTLTGNGRSSPRLRAMRIHYPRFSYLERYLPAVYRADEESAHFLDRYLANMEGIATAVEDRIAAAQALFDPRTAPAEALEWLAGWFELALDPAWDEAKRRLLIAHAADFFRWRGTVRGLRTALALAVEEHADPDLFGDRPGARPPRTRIVEMYQTDAGRDRRTAHRFRVLLPVPIRTEAGREAVAERDPAALAELARRVVELEKPAHTVFDVRFYWEAFRVGEARLGQDTLVDLGGRSPALLPDAVLGRAHLGEGVLADPIRDRRRI